MEILIRCISLTCVSLRSPKPIISLRRMRAYSEMYKFIKLSIKVFYILSDLDYFIIFNIEKRRRKD